MADISGYHFEPGFVVHHLGDLGTGLLRTLAISAIGMAGSLIAGVLLGAVCALRVPVARQLVTVYVEVFRNTPLLVQIFFLYFALPDTGLRLGGFTVGWLSLALWGGAYTVENFRAGFEAVEGGYVEACRALGFSRLAAFRQVTLPLGARIALPSVTNILISVFKNSSFMVAISYPELTETAVNLVAVSFRVFEMFLAIGVVYLALVWLLSLGAGAVERRFAIPGGH
ncbi:amino acid ABC transporter membrane protein 1, PAAT family [Streptomyces sp. DvalAA-14]|uniref:amino acid ABC transporter permease n=1 Tax=unclassified Streptomyces TaxID=2593676 RepID=UPI00081B98D0|nr:MULTISPECIES: amino acid ABC transporter permease [unclassified Streptomyces]MYS20256.1 ABC transporter permease subunit [Streptomyces sp. SID4948]SCD64700.1 amino acid ABC transporter membrane protein 1, PAAT family [Streptomyces sp. DvalAA-14]